MQALERYRQAVADIGSRRQGRKTREPVTSLLQARYQGNAGLASQANKGRDVRDYQPIQEPGTGKFYFMWGYDKFGDPCHPMPPGSPASDGSNKLTVASKDFANGAEPSGYVRGAMYPAGAYEVVDTRTPIYNYPHTSPITGSGTGTVITLLGSARGTATASGKAKFSGIVIASPAFGVCVSGGIADLRRTTAASLNAKGKAISTGFALPSVVASSNAVGRCVASGFAQRTMIYQDTGTARAVASGFAWGQNSVVTASAMGHAVANGLGSLGKIGIAPIEASL